MPKLKQLKPVDKRIMELDQDISEVKRLYEKADNPLTKKAVYKLWLLLTYKKHELKYLSEGGK
jgi:Tfp pilus assembly protein PilN